jgi:hypothetical protein
MLTVTRESFLQIGQTGIGSMLVEKTRQVDASLPLASMTADFEQVEFALKLAESD